MTGSVPETEPSYGLAGRLVDGAALAAGYLLVLQALLTAAEIVARKLFNHSFQGVDELGGYMLALTASLGFGYAALHRAHTRVDFALSRLPLRARCILHLAAAAVLFGLALFLLWNAWRALGETLTYGSIANSPLQTPLWIPQTLWLAGFGVFALCSGLVLLRAVQLWRQGDLAGLEAALRPPSLDEEIDEALADSTGEASQ
ncbi:TRAP transporter small permease [Fluviibacterium sp. DFM31]|uniref:TRAP transporter small permease protein n=1 Tax=Meridianimarinicoccus marinus TaxID=3231483 RepID=A0ABV3L838_9RHOB